MPTNPFDKASRYAAKVDPSAFLAWALGLPAEGLAFDGWLDTRALPLPHEPDQIGDTVARLRNPAVTEAPWAVAVEFQTEPDPLMFGRLMVYLGHVWQSLRPDSERGSRFNVGSIVINLTGAGGASRDMRWPGTQLVTHLGVVERNLAGESADGLLTAIESGQRARALLPWLPLMTGGDESGIIGRWKKVAEGEPDFRHRANYAGLALVFANAAGREEIWKTALEGWNVIESSVVNEWIAEGRTREAVAAVVAVLEAKYGSVPPDVESRIRATSDLVTLQNWIPLAVTTATLDAFRQAAHL